MTRSSDIFHGKILIVDDQEANVLLLERMLRGAGYDNITSTRDPTTVCDLYFTNRYDLILLDLLMPVMDGFQVIEGLKDIEMDGYLPLLVITAQPDHKLRALKAGAKDFVSKPFDIGEVLLRVYNLLEVRLLHLEMKRLYDRVLKEQKVSERLLLNVLPASIAERLNGRPEVIADSFTDIIADTFKDVSVVFADIVEFTKFSESVSVKVLVEVLNEIFSRFDDIAERRGLEKIKTIGDCYMVAAGLPVPVADHAARAANMALDMIEAMERFNRESPYKLNVRIGIDTGAAMAGVIGKKKFLYDLWGDVVNTASRMESHGIGGRIQATDAIHRRLEGPFVFEERGVILVKGKGEMHTWFLNGRNGQPAPAGCGSAGRVIGATG
jgi:adenylate cyclase